MINTNTIQDNCYFWEVKYNPKRCFNCMFSFHFFSLKNGKTLRFDIAVWWTYNYIDSVFYRCLKYFKEIKHTSAS